MVYLGACLIAGIRLAREKQVNMRVIPTRTAVDESIDMAREILFASLPQGPGADERQMLIKATTGVTRPAAAAINP